MRIHIHLSPNSNHVPFNYQSHLTGAIHKWMGQNIEHGKLSFYSFSWLSNARAKYNGLDFPFGTSFFFSAYDEELIKRLIAGIREDSYLNYGMEVREILLQASPEFESGKKEFLVASPVLVKRKTENGHTKHYLFQDSISDTFLTETLSHKLEKAGLSSEGLKISFSKDYLKARSKLVTYKGIANKVSICPVQIEGTPEQLAFAWNVGVGNSTGIGFGAIK